LIALTLSESKGLSAASPETADSVRDLACLPDLWSGIVQIIDPETGKKVDEVFVGREPIAAAITPDKRHLIAATHLPDGRSDKDFCTATVWLVDLASGEKIKEFYLPNGGTAVKGLRISPDGKYAAVTHVIGQFKRPTFHLRLDWMAGNALTLIDLSRSEVLGSVLLDDRTKGAGNPWGLDWTDDGKILVVAHSGTHEVSIIDFSVIIDRIMALPAPVDPGLVRSGMISEEALSLGSYTPMFPGSRRRLKLPEGDLGPREVEVLGQTAYITNYFSKTVTMIDLATPDSRPRSILADGTVSPPSVQRTRKSVLATMTPEKLGEFYFHDASICLQEWQSCASCHPGGGRSDGLNWDLLNDGTGNPKNTKSLLLTFETPPAMSTGVRKTAHDAVVAGLKHILFTEPKEEIVVALESYIRSLKPIPSPRLAEGKLSHTALRGEKVFQRAGCADCHPGPVFTDKTSYDVGTRGPRDKPADSFDTPTLVEVWRTAPYLHDGSAATIRDVLTNKNKSDQHGTTSKLSEQEISDLCEYVLSL
jgi:hypothetical protein